MQVQFNPELEDLELVTPSNAEEMDKLSELGVWQSNRSIYVFDMDGTICDSTHRHHYLQSVDADGNIVPRRGGKDWDSFFTAQKDDVLYPPIAGIMEALLSNLKIVIVLTARPESQRSESVRWLKEWSVPYHALFMRPEGNRTDDNDLKPKQLHTYLGTHVSRVATIFEDRRRIVHALRHHGFHVCHVAEGDF